MQDTPNTKIAIAELLEAQPQLGYQGWRLPQLTDDEFAESRQLLARAIEPLKICSKVFRDSRFRTLHKGARNAYHIKHVIEFWDFSPSYIRSGRYPEMVRKNVYNGIYIAEGVAVAAALIEGYQVERRSPLGSGSFITFPGIRHKLYSVVEEKRFLARREQP
jgi:hypothetical protein